MVQIKIQKTTKTFQVQKQNLIKMENKLEKIELTNYNLLIAQDLWQAHYLADEILRIK